MKDPSGIDEDDSKTTSDEVRAVHTSPHHYQQQQQRLIPPNSRPRNVEWTFAMGLLYSVSLLTTVGKKKSKR